MSKNKLGILEYIDLLGMTARDRVTGFTGVIVSVSFDLFGCVQVIIRPPVSKEGKLEDAHFLDVQRMEIDDKVKRVMPVPSFRDEPAFATEPAKHKHGPAASKPMKVTK